MEIELDKHHMERQSNGREARFRSLLEHAGDIIVVLDAAGSITYFNPASVRLFGSSALRRFEQLVIDFIEPADLAPIVAAWRTVAQQAGAKQSISECRVRAGDGTWHTLTGTFTNLLDDPAVQGIVVNAHDITLQKKAEETLERLFVAEQRHAHELATLNLAFRTMASSLELPHVLVAITAEVKRLIGTESVSVLLRDGDELKFAAASGPGAEALIGTRLPASAGLAGAVLSSRMPTIVADAQADARFYQGVDAQTGLITRNLLAMPLLKDGTALGVMEAVNKAVGPFNAHDLDLMQAIAGSAVIALENARLYETLRDHNQRLQAAQPRLIQTEKMAALGRLTASLAHEINNPLQVVQGSLNLIGEVLEDLTATDMPDMARSAIQPHVAMALNEVERLAQSVHRLRDFAQSSRSAVAVVNVDVVIEQVLDLTAQWIATRLIKVERHDLTTMAERQITANPDHLKQLLLNLVLNAIDVMPHGGTLRLDTIARLRHAERGVCIAISDTGPDISAALLPHVFEPFRAVRANDSSLGLSICYELAASLGGEITVTSEPGQATTFVVWLPNSTGEKTT